MNENNSVFLIGGGRSALEGINLGLFDKIKGNDIWSLNFAYKIMPYLPSTEVWIDKKFFSDNMEDLQKLHQKGVRLITAYNSRYERYPEVTTYKTTRNVCEWTGKKMVENNNVFVGTLGQCGFFSLSLAISMGYKTIYLLGYDFGTPKYGEVLTHCYQEDAERLKIISKGIGKKDVYYNKECKLKAGVEDYELYSKEDVNIYNVSVISNIQYFPKISYRTLFEMIKGDK